ncbi:MAG: hypothetical protein R2748_14625 [Bryobacterales bacterium]
MRGRFWIAKSDYGWVRTEAETIDTASFGLFLLKLQKGAQMEFNQVKVTDEVWLLDGLRLRFDAQRSPSSKGCGARCRSPGTTSRNLTADSRIITDVAPQALRHQM